MLFSEKLDFLMHLTATSNRALADVLQIDPSAISRMRRGQRIPKRSSEHLNAMSRFFAQNITTDYQRAALAETIGQRELRLILNTSTLAVALCEWLANGDVGGGAQRIHTLLHEFGQYSDTRASSGLKLIDSKNVGAQNRAFYGNHGKRSAVRALAARLQALDTPCELLVSSDENLDWLAESPTFPRELAEMFQQYAKSGGTVQRIATPIHDISDAIAATLRWLPVYMTGKIESWYYPRLRDNVLHRTLIVAKGVGAVVSTSVGFKPESGVTFLWEDADISNALVQEFYDLRAKCIPLATAYRFDKNGSLPIGALLRFSELPGRRVSMNRMLPSCVLPVSLLSKLCGGQVQAFTTMFQSYEQRLKSEEIIELIHLPTIGDIGEGKISVLPTSGGQLTPGEWRLFLGRLLELMARYANYIVVLNRNEAMDATLLIAEGSCCLAVRAAPPFTIFEIKEAHIVAAAQDYMLQCIEGWGDKSFLRRETMSALQELIARLPESEPSAAR